MFFCEFCDITKRTFSYRTPPEHTLKSGPETGDPETWESGNTGPDTQDPGTGTLGHGTLTPSTLEMGLWDLNIATLRLRILRAGPWELMQISSIPTRATD